MPIRMLRDWTDSEAINKLSFGAEVFFVRLIMKADDFGRFHGNTKLLKSLLYPLKDKITEQEIEQYLDECCQDLIIYGKGQGKQIVEIKNFGQRMRRKISKFPEIDSIVRTNDRNMRTNDRLNRIELNTNRIEEKGNTPIPPSRLKNFNPIQQEPSPEEVVEQAANLGIIYSLDDAKSFIENYKAKGWTLPSGVITNWTCRLRSYKSNGERFKDDKKQEFKTYAEVYPAHVKPKEKPRVVEDPISEEERQEMLERIKNRGSI